MKKKSIDSSTRNFLLIAGGLLLGWLICYEGYLKHLGQPDAFLTFSTAQAGQQMLSSLGYNVSTDLTEEGVELSLQNIPLLEIADNCNGLAVFALFSGFVAAFPGLWKNKIWFIPAGIIILFFANVLRVALLTLIQIHHPKWLYFNHKYTFTIIIYAVVFGLWMLWVHKFTRPTISKEKYTAV